MFPAALAIVVQTFPLHERGKALALFFGIAGGLTAVGPALGGFLTQWTWRAIFWVNIPVAVIALDPDRAREAGDRVPAGAHGLPRARPDRRRRRAQRLRLPAVGDLGLEQPADDRRASSVGARAARRRSASSSCGPTSPLIDVQHLPDPAVPGREPRARDLERSSSSPSFFFASEYAQIALGKSASAASLVLLYFFIGFVVAAQIGGRMLDRVGAKRPVVLGCALAAVGFWLWAAKVTEPRLRHAGLVRRSSPAPGWGSCSGPASTDAVNRASRLSYGEATGITQTVRNYAASLGLAILGTPQRLAAALAADDLARRAGAAARRRRRPRRRTSRSRSGRDACGAIPHFVRLDFAYATRSVLYAMAAIMAAAAVVALVGLRRGLQEESVLAPETA